MSPSVVDRPSYSLHQRREYLFQSLLQPTHLTLSDTQLNIVSI